MGWVFTAAVLFGLVASMFSLAADHASGVVIGLLASWAPLAYAVWHAIQRSSERQALHEKLAQEMGVPLGSGFDHAEGGTGVIIDTKGKRLAIHVDGVSKTYGYDQIRDVQIVKETATRTRVLSQDIANAAAAKRNSGLFINARDVDYPKWRIAMNNEAMQQRWLEICNQEMREGGIV